MQRRRYHDNFLVSSNLSIVSSECSAQLPFIKHEKHPLRSCWHLLPLFVPCNWIRGPFRWKRVSVGWFAKENWNRTATKLIVEFEQRVITRWNDGFFRQLRNTETALYGLLVNGATCGCRRSRKKIRENGRKVVNWSRQRGKSEEKKKQSDKTKQKDSAWNLRNGIIIVASMINKKKWTT